jgi:hypothetical protein
MFDIWLGIDRILDSAVELLHSCLNRVPFWFSGAFALLSATGLISAKTLAKFSVLGMEPCQQLIDDGIPAQVIPECLGGLGSPSSGSTTDRNCDIHLTVVPAWGKHEERVYLHGPVTYEFRPAAMGIKVAVDWIAEDGKTVQPVIDSALFECADGPIRGKFTPPHNSSSGMLVFRLDNSFSWKNAKMVQWRAYSVEQETGDKKIAETSAPSSNNSIVRQWLSQGFSLGNTLPRFKHILFGKCGTVEQWCACYSMHIVM